MTKRLATDDLHPAGLDFGREAWRELGLDMTRSGRALRLASRLLGAAFVLLVVALLVTPWQQSVTGLGRVIAYAPLERQQAIESPIAGRVVEWLVEEGEHVQEGQLLAIISDNDPELVGRLERARTSTETRLDTAKDGVNVVLQQIIALEAAQTAALSAAASRVAMALDRLTAAEQARDAAVSGKRAADLNLERQTSLAEAGLTSTRNLELAQLAAETAGADLERARATMRAADGEIKALRAERRRIEADTAADIEKARSSLQSVKGDVGKYEADLADREVEVARQHTMRITAPRPGAVLRLVAKQGGEYVAAGDPVVILVPETDARAVEIWVDGNDVPLVSPGRMVRLQFEGWPAVQFVGWPSVAVGTFAGEVAFVDATDDGKGHFRVVVIPTAGEGQDERWPDARFLRQGVQVNGWILLDNVRLGFELWRQWNGFPPAMRDAPPQSDSVPKAGAAARKAAKKSPGADE
ncbi:MAG: HlyD family efflux transporter periplasmic adaptor subunit [Deltaproteobacteria bacterium]|nr:HlyD family efflux transporter periplasmic adaptor subunit [Nannocystaceae bacterium]